MPGTAIILFAHGSRDPDWAAPFHAIRQKIGAAQPGLRVELAFLELMQPSLEQAADDLARGCERIVIAPLFMAQGTHLKRDVSGILDGLRRRHAAVKFEVLPAIGEIEGVLNAISASVVRAATST